DCDEHRAGWEIRRSAEEITRPLQNRIRSNLMRQIDDSHVRRDAQHHSFADRNGVIIGAEIRHEDNRAQALGMSLIRPPRLSGWRRVGRLAVDAAGREKHSHEREHDDNPPPNTSAFPAARSRTRRPLEMPQSGSVPEMYWSSLRAH